MSNRLWMPHNEFNFEVDNFGATYSAAAFGTSVSSHATNANQKGTPVSLISGASVTEDCYGVIIKFNGGVSNGSSRRFLCDLLIDPAGGTSWSVLINNLYLLAAGFGFSPTCFYFPVYIKAGTSIGMQIQGSVANVAQRVGVRLLAKPSHPELVKCGSYVDTFGAVTASTEGTAITPGSNGAWGAYTASLGVTARDLWWWQAGYGLNDTTVNNGSLLLDVAVNATNKIKCLSELWIMLISDESVTKPAFGDSLPYRNIASGQDVYIRGNHSATPDSNNSVVAYGLGG